MKDTNAFRCFTLRCASDWPIILKTAEEIEAEANEFAMCLLMPEDWVRKEYVALGSFDFMDEKKMKTLAKKFGVPESLMAIRLGQISKSKPA